MPPKLPSTMSCASVMGRGPLTLPVLLAACTRQRYQEQAVDCTLQKSWSTSSSHCVSMDCSPLQAETQAPRRLS